MPMGASNLVCNVDGCFASKSNAWSSNACPECEAYMDGTGEWPASKRQVGEWLATQPKTSATKTATVEVVQVEESGDGSGIDPDGTFRQPFIYNPKTRIVYLGHKGMHHGEVAESEPDLAFEPWYDLPQGQINHTGYGKGFTYGNDLDAGRPDADEVYEALSSVVPDMVRYAKTAGKTRTQLLNDAQTHADQYGPDTSEVVQQLADGWTVRRPTTLADIEREGTLMGNCVADGDYNREVSLPSYTEDGIWQSNSLDWGNPEHWSIPSDNYYHSLRDPDNLPHATWTNETNVEGRHGSHPKEEHWSRLREFMPQLPEWEPMTRCWQCGEVKPDAEITVGPDNSKNCQGCIAYNDSQRPTLSHTSNEFDPTIWMDRIPVPDDQITWVTGEDDQRSGYLLCPECGGEGHIELFHREDDEAMSRCGDCGHEWPEALDTFTENRTSAFDKSLWTGEKDEQADQIEWDTCCTDGCDEFATDEEWHCQHCVDYWGNVGHLPSDRQEVEDWYGPRPMSDKTGHMGLKPVQGETDRGLRPTVPPASPRTHAHKGLTNPYSSASAYLSAVADLGFVVKSE